VFAAVSLTNRASEVTSANAAKANQPIKIAGMVISRRDMAAEAVRLSRPRGAVC
jgi:hypothetical protein